MIILYSEYVGIYVSPEQNSIVFDSLRQEEVIVIFLIKECQDIKCREFNLLTLGWIKM